MVDINYDEMKGKAEKGKKYISVRDCVAENRDFSLFGNPNRLISSFEINKVTQPISVTSCNVESLLSFRTFFKRNSFN